jgi:signal transduction histidine kinase
MPLASLLTERKAQLIEAWRRRVADVFAPAAAPDPEIVDSLPDFIEELAAWLREGPGAASELLPRSDVARVHGEQRFHAGFDLRSVIREYGVLRECILDLLDDAGEHGISTAEDRVLSRAINMAIADAAEQYSRQRDLALERQASEHLAFLAHELRNPLGSVRLAFGLLKRHAPGHRQVAPVERGLARLQRLIDDSIIDVELRRQLHDGVPLARRPVDIAALGREVVAESEPEAEAKRLRVGVDAPPALEIDGEPRLLRSVLSNLVRNALKFSVPGGTVAVRLQPKEEHVTVEVEDSCGGIPAGKAEELFLPFHQRGGDRSGFGLGLAITKQAVEAHRGSIQVHSVEGKGCVFVVALPSPARGGAT